MRDLFSDWRFLAAMALFTAIVAGLQVYGGAYQAEYNAHADEAAHFVSALLVRDYIGQWPPPDPLPWAARYYIHYPKVGIGQWPPGYYISQALWWLVFPVSRASALWLHLAMTQLGMVFFYLLARRIQPGWPPVVAGVLLWWTRIVQESYETLLSDLFALVAALAVLWLLTRLIEGPGTRRLLGVVGGLGWALAIKGTGVALLAAPLLALAASGRGSRLRPLRAVAIFAGLGTVVAGAYLWQYRGSMETIRIWAGLTTRIPWRIDLLPDLAGIGCLVLAGIGLVAAAQRRQPAVVAAAAVLLSLVGSSYFIRAIREPRHWIAAVPAILLLNLAAYGWLQSRWPRLTPVAALLALSTFPFSVFRQQPEGFRELASQLPLPARMLVSASVGWGEGPWIATVALGEARPASTIARATKLMAATSWNGDRYQLLVHSDEDVDRLLDEAALDIVVLHNAPEGVPNQMPHHALLRGYLERRQTWKRCAQVRTLEAYCRTNPPRFARKPLQIDLRARIGQVIEER